MVKSRLPLRLVASLLILYPKPDNQRQVGHLPSPAVPDCVGDWNDDVHVSNVWLHTDEDA